MAQHLNIVSVEPTVFFVHDGNALRQLVRVRVDNRSNEEVASLSVCAEGVNECLSLGAVATGTTECDVFLPDVRHPTRISLGLWGNGVLQDERSVDWRPQKHWEVYLVHYSHHDLGYTDLPRNVLKEHADFIEEALRYCEETEDWPEEAKFRYLVEQAYSVVQFVESRPREAVERLSHFIKSGQIEVTALLGNQITELCGHEELIRLLYPAFRLRHDYGIDVVTAEHKDIPGFSWGLASILKGAGIRYFCPGVPLWYFRRGEKPVHPCWDESVVLPMEMPGAFWWEGPDGARVLLWYDVHGYDEWLPTSYEHALRELPERLRDLERREYPYDVVSYTIRGGHRDNAPPTLCSAYIAKAWNRHWAYPRLMTSTHKQFLEVFEKRWGSTLKSLRGELPGTDYPVGATCTPKETALNRTTHDGLLTGEKLATLASIVADYHYPKSVLDEAYRNALYYDEHCWGMWHSGGPALDGGWSEKGGLAYRAAALTHDMIVKASNKMVDEVTYPEDGYYITVFNTLSWERTDIVRVPMRTWAPCGNPLHWVEARQEGEGAVLVSGGALGRGIVVPPCSLFEEPFELVDVSTGHPVPYQVIRLKDPQAAQPWAAERVALGNVDPSHLSEIVFVAEGLPSMGYKTYRILPCEQWPHFSDDGSTSEHVLENRFFTLQLDPHTGAVVRLFDKELGRDLIDRDAPHGFAQMVVRRCETGEEETSRITDLSVSEVGPVYTTIRLKGEVSGCPRWTQEITLYHTLKRMDIHARVLRDSTPMLEVYFAFPFHVETPRFRFEASGSVIEPIRDQLPGSNTDYYAMQHWADVYNDEWGVVWTPVDTPMAEFGGLWPGYVSGAHHGVTPPGYGHEFLRPGELVRGHIYALAMYSNFRTNFINVHPGETLFRYSFGTHNGDWRVGRAWQFGWSVVNPPLAVWMKGPQQGSLASSGSFCQIDAPNVLLLTFKSAEDGNGFILRLMETEGKETKLKVTIPVLTILHAYETNLVEEDRHLLHCTSHSVETKLKPFGISTIRLVTQQVHMYILPQNIYSHCETQ